MWTDGVYTWIGPAECVAAGFLIGPDSPAIDTGLLIAGHHCPAPGPDPSGCVEWWGAAPDIGACEYVSGPTTAPAPTTVVAILLGQTGEDIAGAEPGGRGRHPRRAYPVKRRACRYYPSEDYREQQRDMGDAIDR